MCEPVSTSLAIASIAATAIGTGVSMYGQEQQASAQAASASYAAKVASNNQILANNEAQDAIARGQVADQQKANQTAQLIGRDRAASAANGVDVNSGSAVALQSDSAGAGELDQLTITSNATREAAGYTNEGINYQNQASADEASSKNDLQAGNLSAVSTVVNGAGGVASQWYNYSNGTRLKNVPGGLY